MTTIFDGVDISPTTPTTLQRMLPFGLLALRTIYEADKQRERRLAARAQGKDPTTVREMMELAGVKLPDVRLVMAELLGGSPELTQAATLIGENPDLGTLLQRCAGLTTTPEASTAEPIVTPPPTHEPKPVPPSPPSSPPPPPAATIQSSTHSSDLSKFRADFTREVREAARVAAAATTTTSPPASPPLPRFRADLTREGREAARAAAASATTAAPPSLPKFRPEFTREGREAAKAAAAAAASATASAPSASPPNPESRPSLVAMVERQLATLVRTVNADQAKIDERLRRAEEELAELRAELRELIAQRAARDSQPLAPSPRAAKPTHAPPVDAPTPTIDTATSSARTETTTEPAVTPVSSKPAELDTASPTEPALPDSEPLASPPSASEAEIVQVVDMIGAVSEQIAAQNHRNFERVDSVEREVVAVKAIVTLLREGEASTAPT